MANDCLVTKLKGIVNNDNLPILNTVQLGLVSGDTINAAAAGVIMKSDGVSVKIQPKNGLVTNMDDPTVIYAEQESTGNLTWSCIKPSNPEILNNLVTIKPKYNVVTLLIGYNVILNIDELSCCKLAGVGNINSQYKLFGAYGNLGECLKNSKDSIHNLYLSGNKIKGSAEDLYECTALENLSVDSISGDWYNLIVSQRSLGRTNGTIKYSLGLHGSFNGHKPAEGGVLGYENELNGVISWTQDRAYTFSPSQLMVYCVGYSAVEITTNTSTGGIWEGATAIKCD